MQATQRLRSLLGLSALVIGSILPVSAAQAETVKVNFNNKGGDSEFLTARNLTKNQVGYGDPITASAGNVIDVNVYIHNTGILNSGNNDDFTGQDAKNVRLKVILPTGENATQVIKAELSADNADTVTGTIVNGTEVGSPNLTINADGAVKVEYVPGSVRWFPDRLDVNASPVNLPNSQDGNTITTTGINLGDIKACFAHAGILRFKVKLTGPAVKPPVLSVKKDVRLLADGTTFQDRTDVNPGNKVEYRVVVTNEDYAVPATQVRLKDVMESGLSLEDGKVTYADGTSVALANGITSDSGVVVAQTLKPRESLTVTYKVATDKAIANGQCRKNEVTASSDNAVNKPTDTATVCFIVPTSTPKPTPSPSPIPNPTPTTPQLPQTGPEVGLLLGGLAVGGVGLGTLRQMRTNARLKKMARRPHVR